MFKAMCKLYWTCFHKIYLINIIIHNILWKIGGKTKILHQFAKNYLLNGSRYKGDAFTLNSIPWIDIRLNDCFIINYLDGKDSHYEFDANGVELKSGDCIIFTPIGWINILA